MSERNPGAAFFVAVFLGAALLVAYPFSWGPYFWLQASGKVPERLLWTDHLYDPCRWILYVSAEFVNDAWRSYLVSWAANADMPYFNPATGTWE